MKPTLKALVLATLLLAGSLTSFAQNWQIRGVVVDNDGAPVIGAALIEEGTKNGTTTDLDGAFTMTVKSGKSVLDVVSLGMKEAKVPVAGQAELRIVLAPDDLTLENSVVTALGIKRDQRALGYAVASVNSDEITAGHSQNAVLALSGKVAGVDISGTAGGPAGSTTVIIRGNSQLSGSNRPLYVIDGIPVDNTQFDALSTTGQYPSGYDYGDVLSSIDPNDIENISVLKGASAAALYGSQASNGVVLITTKSASKKKGWSVELDSNVSLVTVGNEYDDYQREYGSGINGKPVYDPVQAQQYTCSAWGGKLDPSIQVPIFNGEMKPYANVDNNILSFFRTGSTVNNTVAVSNTGDKSSVRFSVSDMRNSDIVPNSGMNRTSMALKARTQIGKRLTLEGRATYTVENVNNRPALANSSNNIGQALYGIAPNIDQKWLSEGYCSEDGNYTQWTNSDYRINPYWSMNKTSNETAKNRLIANVNAEFKIIDGLKLVAKAGTDYYDFNIKEYSSMYTPQKASGAMSYETNRVYKNTYEAMLKYDKTFGDFNLSAFVGGNLEQSFREKVLNNNSGQVIPGWEDITNYSTLSVSHALVRREIRSAFGMVNVGYKDWAYLEATLRNDVSSTLAENYRSYLYPSVSGSALLSNIFGWNNDKISLIKLRGSWAEVGGDTDPYSLDLSYGLHKFQVDGTSMGEVTSTTVPYAGLKPTRTYSWEVGADLRFFDSRLNLDFTYYNTRTSDQILSLPISETTGYSYAMVNAGEITNKGIEAQLSIVPVRTRNVTYETTFNFSMNRNKVVELHPSVTNYQLSRATLTDTYIVAMEGEAYGAILGKKFARTDDGQIIVNAAGLPTYDTELSVLGNGNYDYILGWGHQFQVKGFSFSALFDMKFGAEVYTQSEALASVFGTSTRTLEGRADWYASEDAREKAGKTSAEWTPTGGFLVDGVVAAGTDASGNTIYEKNTRYVNPQVYWDNVYQYTAEPFIRDASYIKLRELSASYTFGKKYFKKCFIESISLSAFGRNLWVLYSDIPNVDPESSYNSNHLGIEYSSLPARRSFGFGINMKF